MYDKSSIPNSENVAINTKVTTSYSHLDIHGDTKNRPMATELQRSPIFDKVV